MNYAYSRLNCNHDNEIITLMQRFTIIETRTHIHTHTLTQIRVSIVKYSQ